MNGLEAKSMEEKAEIGSTEDQKETSGSDTVERRVMCGCMTWAGIYPDSWGDHHHSDCPKYKTEKFPRLFYEEDGLNAWVPAPDNINNIIIVEDQMEENEIIEIRFKRFDMTDEKVDSLPED